MTKTPTNVRIQPGADNTYSADAEELLQSAIHLAWPDA
jgi:hypothetical protein